MDPALETVEDAFNTVFVTIAQHRLLQRQPRRHRVGDKGLPAEPLDEGGNVVSLSGNAGDVVADGLDHPLPAARRAAAAAHILGFPLALLFPGYAEQPVHPMVFEYGVNGLHERRFVGDLPLAPPSGRRQGGKFFLRIAQPCFQPRCLLLGMHGRSHHQHPLRPCLCPPRCPTSPFNLIAFGREHLVTTVIGADYPFQRTGVAPVNGNGDKYTCWCPTICARVSKALILQSPTNSRPLLFSPFRIRSMTGMYKPSSARSPDSTSVDSGMPKGSNDPIITLIWGRVGSSLLWPNCSSPSAVTACAPATVVASQRIMS